jgi:hypothetical protein
VPGWCGQDPRRLHDAKVFRESQSKNGRQVVSAWSGSGPDYLHMHHAGDEAWHVVQGTPTFKFPDGEVEVSKGSTVFVPAGVPHTYYEANGPTRYFNHPHTALAAKYGMNTMTRSPSGGADQEPVA